MFSTSEFSKTTAQEWLDKITTDLRGKSFDSLVKTTPEGIEIRPNYSAEQKVHALSNMAGKAMISGKKWEDWFINQWIDVTDQKAANQKILAILNAGVNSISLDAATPIDFDVLFKDVLPEFIEIRFVNTSSENLNKYTQWIDRKGFNSQLFIGSFELFVPQLDELTARKSDIKTIASRFPKMKAFTVNGAHFFNQGATQAQQLGITLAMVNELMQALIADDFSAQEAAQLIDVKLASGAHYFLDIAKYRSAFALWEVLLKEYGVSNLPLEIHGSTATWTQTVADINNNMLRGATQALSAVLGGCKTVTVVPFDHSVRPGNEFSERMARNTQIMLRDEAFAGKVIDPADGSYYLAYLTTQIGQRGWEYFLALESAGGYQKAMESHKIEQDITAAKKHAFEAAQSGNTTILGVNKFPNNMEDLDGLIRERKDNNITTATLSDAITNK